MDAVFTALNEQAVTLIGTEAVELVIPRVTGQIKELKQQRAIVAAEVEKLLDDFLLSSVLMSTPGVGIKTAATILLTIGTPAASGPPASSPPTPASPHRGRWSSAATGCSSPPAITVPRSSAGTGGRPTPRSRPG